MGYFEYVFDAVIYLRNRVHYSNGIESQNLAVAWMKAEVDEIRNESVHLVHHAYEWQQLLRVSRVESVSDPLILNFQQFDNCLLIMKA